MAAGDTRYEPVNAVWAGINVPPCTRDEATKAVTLLCRKFGRKDGGPWQVKDFKRRTIRRCWVSLKGGDKLTTGWPRITHDLSHMIYDRRVGPQMRRRHNSAHARLELEMSQYVATSGWLDGALKPKRATKPSKEDQRAKRLEQTESAIFRWQTKAKRAANALKKLSARRKRLMKAMGQSGG